MLEIGFSQVKIHLSDLRRVDMYYLPFGVGCVPGWFWEGYVYVKVASMEIFVSGRGEAKIPALGSFAKAM